MVSSQSITDMVYYHIYIYINYIQSMIKMILYIYIYMVLYIYIYYLCVWPLITIPFSHLPLVPRVSWRACSTTSLVTSSSRATEATECFTRGSSSSCAAKLSSSSTNHSWASQIFPGLNPSKNGGFTMVPWCNLASPCFNPKSRREIHQPKLEVDGRKPILNNGSYTINTLGFCH